jgi:hypothetical protein
MESGLDTTELPAAAPTHPSQHLHKSRRCDDQLNPAWQPTFNCLEAESHWCPERRRAKSVSVSAAEPTGNPTAAIAHVVVGALAKSVGRWTITKHFAGCSSGPVGGVGQLGGRHATENKTRLIYLMKTTTS